MQTILFVVENPGLHGAPTQVLLIAPILQRLGLRPVCVVPTGYCNYAKILRQAGVEVIEHRMTRFRNSANPITFTRALLHFVPTILALWRLIKQYRVSAVYASELHEILGPIAAKMSGVQIIWRLGTVERHGRLGNVFRCLIDQLADNVVLVATAAGDSHFGSKAFSDPRFSIIPAAVDLKKFRPNLDSSGIAQKLGRRPEETWICQIGSLYPVKGIEYYVAAAALVRQRCSSLVKFMQVGSQLELHSQYYSQIVRQIGSLGLEDSFLMLGPRQDVPLLLNTANMLVVSSLSEGQPAVIVEAMACGKPVVATRVGGIPEEVVDGETGILVPPADSNALAEAMLCLIQNPQLAARMGAAGRRRAEQYYGADASAFKLAKLINGNLHQL